MRCMAVSWFLKGYQPTNDELRGRLMALVLVGSSLSGLGPVRWAIRYAATMVPMGQAAGRGCVGTGGARSHQG